MRICKYMVLALVVLGGLALAQDPPPAPEIFWVDDDQTGQGNGSINNPFATIQEGIDEAGNGDVVRVRDGTYNENINFNGKAIKVRSNDGVYGDTIIDGGQNGSCVVFMSGEGNDSILRGFIIQNGSGTACDPDDPNQLWYAGGGIYAWASSPTIEYCEIKNNSMHADYYGNPSVRVARAAAMYCGLICEPKSGGSSSEDMVWPVIQHNSIHDNAVSETTSPHDIANGGGVAIDNPSWATFDLGRGDNVTIIEYNVFYDHDTGQGWEDLNIFDQIIDGVGDVYVQYNEFYRTDPDEDYWHSIMIGYIGSLYFRGNLLHNIRSTGHSPAVDLGPLDFCAVDSNTFYEVHEASATFMILGKIDNCSFIRNILWNDGLNFYAGVSVNEMSLYGVDYNIVKGGQHFIYAGWGGTVTYGQHNLTVDPNLDSTYHIQSSYSSAWETGGDSSVGYPPYKDIDGERKPMGEQFEIGCDEYNDN